MLAEIAAPQPAMLRTSRLSNLAALHVLAFIVLAVIYVAYISDIYRYEGYKLDYAPWKFVASLGAIISLSAAISSRRPTRALFLHFTLVCTVTPVLVLYSCANLPTDFAIRFCLCFVVIIVASAVQFRPQSRVRIKTKDLMYLSTLATLMFVASFYRYGTFSTFNLDPTKVYDLRRLVEAALPTSYAYLIPLFAKVVIPLSVVLAAAHRKMYIVLLNIALATLMYGLTTHKSLLFFPFTTLFFYYAITRARADKMMILAAIAGVVVSLAEFYYYGAGWISSLLARRVFMVPALLNYYYYEYFSANPWYWWSSSRITLGLVSSPYAVTAPLQIGKVFFGNPEMSANIGWFGAGYAQAGLFGAMVYSVGAGFVISIFDAHSTRLGAAVVVPLVINQIIVMVTATDFLTLLLTHWLAFSLILISAMGAVPTGKRTNSILPLGQIA